MFFFLIEPCWFFIHGGKCRKPPINVPFKRTFGTPDQGQMLDMWESQTTESALRWQTRHITPCHNLGYILGCGLGVLWTGSWKPWPHFGTITHDLTQDPSIDSSSLYSPFLKLIISFLHYKYHSLTTTPYPCGLNSASHLATLVSLRLAWRPSTGPKPAGGFGFWPAPSAASMAIISRDPFISMAMMAFIVAWSFGVAFRDYWVQIRS